MSVLFCQSEFSLLKEYLVLYRCALNNMRMRVETLHEDFAYLQTYNPIEHIKDRVKSPESIASKLSRRNSPLTAENARITLMDIAGIRCICSYSKDIYLVAEALKRQPDTKLLNEKDYVTYPKSTGYRSYHLIIEVPVYLTDSTEYLPVEVQIRTQAMDFWASLEHKVRYKYNNIIPETLVAELVECADKIAELDKRMYLIQEIADLVR